MANNHCCIDLDGICLADDPKLLEDSVAVETRGREPDAYYSRDIEAEPRQTRSPSRERPVLEHSNTESKKSSKRRNNAKTQEELQSPKKAAYGLPFNWSFTGDKKKKTTTTNTNNQQATKAIKEEAATDSDSDESHPRNATRNQRAIQANVFMISGCEDAQTSADVSNVSSFSLPNPNGRSGGACTSALLKVLYANKDLTFVRALSKMRKILRSGRYSQIPQLTSSHELDITQKFYIVPPNCTGTRRAVLIGINYTGQNGELSGCHNDCLNMKDYIMNEWGFKEEHIIVLMDDGNHTSPTRSNILGAYRDIAYYSQSGDAVFCHYSGHGGRVVDDDQGEEADGYDETLVPVDYSTAGQIRDDDLYTNLVAAMPGGSTLVSLMDCCHSATVLDLPYKYRATDSGDLKLDPLSLDGGNAIITCLLCAFIIIVLCVMLPIMLWV